MENYVGRSKLFQYSSFLVELLLLKGHFGHTKHTQLHTITYLWMILQTCLVTETIVFVKLNENGNLCWPV